MVFVHICYIFQSCNIFDFATDSSKEVNSEVFILLIFCSVLFWKLFFSKHSHVIFPTRSRLRSLRLVIHVCIWIFFFKKFWQTLLLNKKKNYKTFFWETCYQGCYLDNSMIGDSTNTLCSLLPKKISLKGRLIAGNIFVKISNILFSHLNTFNASGAKSSEI